MPVRDYYKGSGERVLQDMIEQYGEEEGRRVFYATANKRGMNPKDNKDTEVNKEATMSMHGLLRKNLLEKMGYVPPQPPALDPAMAAQGAAGGMPPMDPAMMDPAMGGGMPPMDPAMMDPAMGGGMPPMDPAMGGGMPPMDPAMMDPAMGGGMPPMDPAMMDPAMMDPAMMDPAMGGGMPPIMLSADDLMQVVQMAIDSNKEPSGRVTNKVLEERMSDLEVMIGQIMGAVGLQPPPPRPVDEEGEDGAGMSADEAFSPAAMGYGMEPEPLPEDPMMPELPGAPMPPEPAGAPGKIASRLSDPGYFDRDDVRVAELLEALEQNL